jgi:DNA polymerase-3 subunit gamma/tau
LDVVEIDAASHNGVDDARDLRERAVFAPARDRYKIFILDEAHMVTQQGFNALLKIVEEPPEHVKFIFATTEPEKVLGTIRSRTHHYPFRLVPPSELLAYVEQMCVKEGVKVEEGVLPLVVRAGGGSVRDTLSVLDQLIAGSPEPQVTYGHAIGLLGYTHGELLAEVMTSLASGVGNATFQALDKVIHTGQDPRRFGEDLLEYVRDLIIVDQAGADAAALLPGSSGASLEVMRSLATGVGTPALSAMADVMAEALSSMTGATSPTLHLELLMARLLVSRSTSTDTRALAPVPPAPAAPRISTAPAAPTPTPAAPLTSELMVDSWPAILEGIGEKKRAVWTALVGTSVVRLENDVVTIGFPSLSSAEVLKKPQGPGLPANAELVREAILGVVGHRVRFKVQELAPTNTPEAPPEVASAPEEAPAGSWPTVAPPRAEEEKPSNHETDTLHEPEVEAPPASGSLSQVGEAVIREVLGGELISEHPVASDEEK